MRYLNQKINIYKEPSHIIRATAGITLRNTKQHRSDHLDPTTALVLHKNAINRLRNTTKSYCCQLM